MKIVAYMIENKPDDEARWWAYLLPKKAQYLRQFLRHAGLVAAVGKLLKYEGVMLGWCIGVLHKVCASRCDPVRLRRALLSPYAYLVFKELISYVDSIHEFYHVLADGNADIIDEHSVTLMEGRCPKYSASDRAFLEEELREGRLLPRIRDQGLRLQKWKTVICDYNHLIPSFKGFFKDFIYVSRCRDVLKRLLGSTPMKSTLQETYRALFTGSAKYQDTEQSFNDAQSEQNPFMVAFEGVWLLSMRCWPDLLHDEPRKSRSLLHPQQANSSTSFTWPYAAKVVRTLGFSIPCDMDHESGTDGPQSSLENMSVTTGSADDYPSLIERFGVPFESSRQSDIDGVFYRFLMQNPTPRNEITILFVRRSFFLSLFRLQPGHGSAQVPPVSSQGSMHLATPQEPVLTVPQAMNAQAISMPHTDLGTSVELQEPAHDSLSGDILMTDVQNQPERLMPPIVTGNLPQILVFTVEVNRSPIQHKMFWQEVLARSNSYPMIFQESKKVLHLDRKSRKLPGWVVLARDGCDLYEYSMCHKGHTIEGPYRGPWVVLQQIHHQHPKYQVFIRERPSFRLPPPSRDLGLVLFAHPGYDSQLMRNNQAGIS